MGEVVVNSEGKMEFDVPEGGIVRPVERKSGGGSGAAEAAGDVSSVSWERFLPKMVMRVLLVEADDSTRQIIAALLRKCSYRVAAVPDGLKAWELLKGRPHNIDLILTEVELPSISGYALLTLIMEHEVCKNIPVIMMSSHDSVSTVYKCMLRGAADFLVKPVRKNELRNLWQHVWRKQVSITGAGLGPPLESVAQEKDEATAENNEISNHSSGCKSSIRRNKECVAKGSDAQSSCTKPEAGTEKGDTDHNQCISLPKSVRCPGDEVKTPAKEECHKKSRKRQAQDMENGEVQPVQKMFSNYTAAPHVEHTQEGVNMMANTNHIVENSSRAAIDLIGGFDNHRTGTFGSLDTNVGTNKYDVLPLLDLSLRRSHPSGFVNQQNDEMHKLNHSNASPFSRYINKSLQLCTSTSPSPCNQQKDRGTNHTDRHGPAICSPKQLSVTSIQEEKQENASPYSQSPEISHPIAVKGVIPVNFMNDYCSAAPSVYCAQQGSSSLPSAGTAHLSESLRQVNTQCPSDSQPSTSQQYHSLVDSQSISDSIEQTDTKQGKKLENMEDLENVSPANDRSTNSSFCNGNSSGINNAGSGSNGYINAVSISKAPTECGNEERFHVQEGFSHRSLQREAALTKFRLKRKDRCFEKKVRYESRKKLAEQRPRVKGQFVRQAPYETQPGSSSAS